MFLFASAKLDKNVEAAVIKSTEKYLSDFKPLFLRAYMDEFVTSCKLDASNEVIPASIKRDIFSRRPSYQLPDLVFAKPPLRQSIIKEGYVSKVYHLSPYYIVIDFNVSYEQQGGQVTSWKKRHFVVHNADQNFLIEYYESPGGKLKGTVEAAGYNVVAFEQVDIDAYGPHGIKLVPLQPSRRTWYFRFENDRDRNDWMPVFQLACFQVDTSLFSFLILVLLSYLDFIYLSLGFL